jgi:antitoxin component YwqK of YwqJK toxin-antitoxin module
MSDILKSLALKWSWTYRPGFLLTLFLCLSLAGCAPTIVDFRKVKDNALQNGIKEGVYREFYPNKLVKSEIILRDGIMDGVAKVFGKTGKLFAEVNYVHGIAQGEYRHYYETGEVALVGKVIDGKIQGVERKLYKSGKLYEEIFFKDNLPQGRCTTYFETGEIQYVGEYKDGIFQHIEEFDKAGKLLREFKLVNKRLIQVRDRDK